MQVLSFLIVFKFLKWYQALKYKIWIKFAKNIKMNTGKVKFFNESKGYGFIVDDESGKEYFVHISGLVDEVQENEAVSFDLQEGKKGMNAVNVKLI